MSEFTHIHIPTIYITRAARCALILLLTLLATACGPTGAAPTATPTKTPAAADSQPEVAVPEDTPTPAPVPTDTPVAMPVEPATATALPANIAPYTGEVAADPSLLHQRPIFICVNNDPVGRSAHYGLDLADLVYEYIVDGFTITRLTAMYQSQQAERVGPVRSARYPNVWMTYMYDGALACSGGSDFIRYLLKNEVGFPYLDADLDDPSQTRYFTSLGDDYRTRMQASTEGVRRWLADNNLQKEWSRPGFEFSPEPPGGAVGAATVINIAYPGGNSVEWRYDAGLGSYLRFQGGEEQVDPATGRPLTAENVIVMTAKHDLTDIVEDSLGTKSVNIELYGFGDLRVFRNGQVYEGTWRADPETPPRWLGPGDVIIKLKPGQSWVQVIREISEVNYQ
ncbi:MAG: DUF3048 domain-containing protein [Caldilineaceae bacterium]|nr:DUF3048 domain-containing protein [Caldilineaceae bacterium]MCB9156108.1 DUF3048 domain-containing protein [Caldilineaceae bacterium]